MRRCVPWMALITAVALGLGCGSDDDGAGGSSSSGGSSNGSTSSGTTGGAGGDGGAEGGEGGTGATGGDGGSGGESQAPQVTITSPQEGRSFPVDTVVALQATVSDPQEGDLLKRQIFWTKDDGAIVDPVGQGESLTHQFTTPNIYTITVTATDSDTNATSDSVQITIEP